MSGASQKNEEGDAQARAELKAGAEKMDSCARAVDDVRGRCRRLQNDLNTLRAKLNDKCDKLADKCDQRIQEVIPEIFNTLYLILALEIDLRCTTLCMRGCLR